MDLTGLAMFTYFIIIWNSNLLIFNRKINLNDRNSRLDHLIFILSIFSRDFPFRQFLPIDIHRSRRVTMVSRVAQAEKGRQ